MPLNPKSNLEKLERVLHAWNTLAPTATFGGTTKEEFETLVAVSKSARVTVANLENQLKNAIAHRDSSDEIALATVRMVKNGVLADPATGENSTLYETMGYIRRDDRKSGLTRRKLVADKTS
jgi:hypothetical protein